MFEMFIGDEKDSFYGDFIFDENFDLLVDNVVKMLFFEEFEKVLGKFIECEVMVFKFCKGLVDGCEYIFEEVG